MKRKIIFKYKKKNIYKYNDFIRRMDNNEEVAELKQMESSDKKDPFKVYLRNTIGKKRKKFGNEYSKIVLSRKKFVNEDDYNSFLSYIGGILNDERQISNWYNEAKKYNKEDRINYYRTNHVNYKHFIEHGMVGDTYKRLSIAKVNIKDQWDCFLQESITQKFLIFSNDVLFNVAVYAHYIVRTNNANDFQSTPMVFSCSKTDPDNYTLDRRNQIVLQHNESDANEHIAAFVVDVDDNNRVTTRIGLKMNFLTKKNEGGIRYVNLDDIEIDSFIYGTKSVLNPPPNSTNIEKTYFTTLKCDYDQTTYAPSFLLYQSYMYLDNQNRNITCQSGFMITYKGVVYICLPAKTDQDEYMYFIGRGVNFIRSVYKFFNPSINFENRFNYDQITKFPYYLNKKKKEDIKTYSPYFKYDILREPYKERLVEGLEEIVKNRLVKKQYKYYPKYTNEIIIFKGKCTDVLQTDVYFPQTVEIHVNFKLKVSTNFLLLHDGMLPAGLKGGINMNNLSSYLTYLILLKRPELGPAIQMLENKIGYIYFLREHIRLLNKLFNVSVKVLKKLTSIIKLGSFKKTLDVLPDVFNLLYYNSIVVESIVPNNEIMEKIKEYYQETHNIFLIFFINIDFSNFGKTIEYFIYSLLSKEDEITEDDLTKLHSAIFVYYNGMVPSIENEAFFNFYRQFDLGTINALSERIKGIYNIYLSYNTLTGNLCNKCIDIINKQIQDDTLLSNQLSWIISSTDTIGGVRVNSNGDVIVVDNKKSLIRRRDYLINEIAGLNNDLSVLRNNLNQPLANVIALLSPKGKSILNLSNIEKSQEKMNIYKAIFGRQTDFIRVEDDLNETMNTELDFDYNLRLDRLKRLKEKEEQRRKQEEEKKEEEGDQ